MGSRALLLDTIRASILAFRALENFSFVFIEFENAVDLCVKALADSKKIMICGNGGSAADAQHMAAELVGRFSSARPGLSAIALTTDTSALTAIGNDFGFEKIFSRQIEAIGSAGDVLIVISTSGNSPNIIDAVRAARASSIRVIALTGSKGGELAEMKCDALLCAASNNTPRIQEQHLLIEHTLCEAIESALFKNITR